MVDVNLFQEVDFSAKLQKLIENTVADKLKILELKEKELQERENKCNFILENYPSKNIIKIDVGGVVYKTSCDILTKIKDSYFCGLLSNNFKQDEIFIPRNGESFKYILDYLIYGKLDKLDDINMIEKIISDADYYILPNLLDEANYMLSQLEKDTFTNKYARFKFTEIKNGSIVWNKSGGNLNVEIEENTVLSLEKGHYLINLTIQNSQEDCDGGIYLDDEELLHYKIPHPGTSHISDIVELNDVGKIYITYDRHESPIENGTILLINKICD